MWKTRQAAVTVTESESGRFPVWDFARHSHLLTVEMDVGLCVSGRAVEEFTIVNITKREGCGTRNVNRESARSDRDLGILEYSALRCGLPSLSPTGAEPGWISPRQDTRAWSVHALGARVQLWGLRSSFFVLRSGLHVARWYIVTLLSVESQVWACF